MNPFYVSVVFHIETSYLICCTNQMTGFFMERNTRVKWFNWNTFYTDYLLFYCKVLTSIQQLLQKVRTGTLLFTPRTQFGYWTYLRCSRRHPRHLRSVFFTSVLRLVPRRELFDREGEKVFIYRFLAVKWRECFLI